MDSTQPTKKDFEVNLFQNQMDDNFPMEEDSTSIKSFQENLDPLQVGSILEIIFSNLDVNSIKNARQVNPLWSVEGAKMLMTKCYLKIPSNLQGQEEISNSQVLEEFKDFLSHKSSDHSMIPNITIKSIGDMKLWNSLGVLGQQIESLELNVRLKDQDWVNNLLDLLHNIKYLCFIGPLDFAFFEENGFIKVLNSVIYSPEKGRSPLVVSFINLMLEKAEQLEEIEKFSECSSIMIEELKIELNPYGTTFGDYANLGHRVSNFMNKLLSTSRNVLKKLTLVNCDQFLHLLEFPCMPALTSLGLVFEIEHLHNSFLKPCKFSPSFRFSKNVPNLTHFCFDLTERSDSRPLHFAHLFEQTGTATSVKILEYLGVWENFDIGPLLKTFPSIEKCKTSGVGYSQQMFESLWKYGVNLKKLTIKVESAMFSQEVAGLDSFITGFTPETVDKIKEAPNLDPYTLEEMEQLRVNPSILNLKDLEHLTIRYHYDRTNSPKKFLATSGKYAFELMPKDLQVSIKVGHSCAGFEGNRNPLEDVSKLPNVNVLFNDEEWWFYESEDESDSNNVDNEDMECE